MTSPLTAEQEIIEPDKAPVTQNEALPEAAQQTAVTPVEMLNDAVARGADPEVIDKMMSLYERWEANQARKAFDAAISAAKAEIPVIAKSQEVDFTSSKGRTNYRYEDLAGIARVVDPILSTQGLSYRYRTETNENMVQVTCIVSHRDGHSEENSLHAAKDESGNKNSIQAVGSTITYLQRYTLKAALGLAASEDDDGQSSEGVNNEKITTEQADELLRLANECGVDKTKFCKFFSIEKFHDIKAADFEKAKAAIKKKRSK